MAGSTIAKLGELAAQRWGMFTTAQAAAAGVSRKSLSALAKAEAIVRLEQGVYRMTGAPEPELQFIYAPWMAVGGATLPATAEGVPAVVAAGETAAIAHGIGDWYPGVSDFITPFRRTTRVADVRLRVRALSPNDVMYLDGLPALSVERTIADLVERREDRSLIADALAQASQQGKLLSTRRLAEHLEPLARLHGAASGTDLADELLGEAGILGEGLARG